MSSGACHTFPPAVFLVPLAPFRFVAQNLRIQSIFEFREFIPATAGVFDSSLRLLRTCTRMVFSHSSVLCMCDVCAYESLCVV